jgi:hypothetical protein
VKAWPSAATLATQLRRTIRANGPYRFTGGSINRVVVDVSGEAYFDLEREAQALLMRE